jgi:hypothetical protein
VVVNEVWRHLTDRNRSAKDGLDAAFRKAHDLGLISADVPTYADENPDIRKLAKSRIENFLFEIGASIIQADAVSAKQLLSAYFSPSPPFGRKAKKNEFPDAIALFSLEAWAKERGKRVVAVSGDGDWAAFAQRSDWIDVVGKIEDGLSLLREHSEKANELVRQLIKDIFGRRNVDLAEPTIGQILSELSSLPVFGEGQSSFYVENDQVELEAKAVELVGGIEDPKFRIIRADPDDLVITLDVVSNVTASGGFTFSVWDSIDDDYVSLGSSQVDRDLDIECRVMISCKWEIDKQIIDIKKIEIVDAPASVDFGYIEPNYSADQYEDGDFSLESDAEVSKEF